MLTDLTISAKALLGFLRREVGREHALPWHQLAVRSAWLMGRSQSMAPVLSHCGSALSDDYVRVLSRPTLPYLSTAFPTAVWRELLADHCGFVGRHFGNRLYEQVATTGVMLWSGEERAAGVTVHLGGPCPHREGGLTLVMRLDGLPIYRIAFSVVRSERIDPKHAAIGWCLFVGQVQGYPGCFEQIREATRRCRDIAPPDLLTSALLGLAGALGIDRILAINLEDCPSYKKMTSLGHHFDYRQFWCERWGAAFDGQHHRLDLPVSEKPISEVKANHRGRTLAKRRIKHAVAETVGRQLQAVLPSPLAAMPAYASNPDGGSMPVAATVPPPAVELKACGFGLRHGSPWLQTTAP